MKRRKKNKQNKITKEEIIIKTERFKLISSIVVLVTTIFGLLTAILGLVTAILFLSGKL